MNKTEEFIRKARLKHGDKYDYSKVEYVESTGWVDIICKEHGKFLQRVDVHLRGAICQICNKVLRTSNTDVFIDKAKQIHGDKYDYSKVEYTSSLDVVTIICKIHGDFKQTPKSHLRGCGCLNCGIKKRGDNRRNTTDDFIKKAIEIHGDKYDYSTVEYTKSKTNVIIKCRIHDVFLQTPECHLMGHGCQTCGIEKCRNALFSNAEEFIKKAIEIHGDKYDYSKVEYVNSMDVVTIICKKHGEFLQIPGGHLQGRGCNQCGRKKASDSLRSNTEEFIKKAIEIHGDKYDYSKVEYVTAIECVTIICKIHGDFYQKPNGHLCGSGCKDCSIEFIANSKRKNTDEFITEAKLKHGDKYDYSLVEYISCIENVTILCNIHGKFLQNPSVHLQGFGCKECGIIKCSSARKSNTEEFVEKSLFIHGNKYDYSKVEYTDSMNDVSIICKIHGVFLQKPNGHLQGRGCWSCVNKTESKLFEKIKNMYPTIVTQFKQEWCKKTKCLPYDFCIPEHQIIIELDGRQHFRQVMNWQSPEQTFENDKFKEQCANDNNYSVIRLLQEDVWNDTYDWCKELCDAIEEIKRGDNVVNIYLCKNGEYDNF
jgi:very-short-patch-repair endonuclease